MEDGSKNVNTENALEIVYKLSTGKISKEQFKSLFTTVGSRLSTAEMDAIISKLCSEADQIDYKEFLSK
ncbi:troponin c-like protein [Plasmodium vivax India VII]|uniref:Troponin c-like protein n=1 Tax=Plasmodium vivax India VII TaxID=1077284 RepID=A0A0J9SAS1_PLAVI|nr:troponin c-like protein [Plasmodium vivax India VII]